MELTKKHKKWSGRDLKQEHQRRHTKQKLLLHTHSHTHRQRGDNKLKCGSFTCANRTFPLSKRSRASPQTGDKCFTTACRSTISEVSNGMSASKLYVLAESATPIYKIKHPGEFKHHIMTNDCPYWNKAQQKNLFRIKTYRHTFWLRFLKVEIFFTLDLISFGKSNCNTNPIRLLEKCTVHILVKRKTIPRYSTWQSLDSHSYLILEFDTLMNVGPDQGWCDAQIWRLNLSCYFFLFSSWMIPGQSPPFYVHFQRNVCPNDMKYLEFYYSEFCTIICHAQIWSYKLQPWDFDS